SGGLLAIVARLRWRVAPQFRQGQIRDDALSAAFVDDDLIGAVQHFFHGFQEEALARDLWGLCIFFIDRDEALRFTLGFQHDAALVSGSGFADLRRLASCLAELLVGILVGFFDEAVFVL